MASAGSIFRIRPICYNAPMSSAPQNLFLHADGDSFFVACEVSVHPEYRGLPVVVGEDRGIAVAMSYEAKALGVTRGMPVFEIKKRFPKVIILPHHFDLYRKISNSVYDILLSYLSVVEKYSIDECFAEVRPSDITYATSEEKLVEEIKNEISEKLGVTYSLGLARTKALAKTASKLQKPNGAVVLLTPLAEEHALRTTSIEDVWGIGRRTVPRLQALGMKTAYDFVQYPSAYIERHFPEPLRALQLELGGVSLHELNASPDARDQKSIQSTATFRPPSTDRNIIWAELSQNIENACEHARRLGLMTKSVSIFIKNTDFTHQSRDCSLALYADDPGVIMNAIEPAFDTILRSSEKIRSTGITLHNLRRIEDVPHDLFEMQATADSRSLVERFADKIRAKFGSDALMRASSLNGSSHDKDNSFPKGHS